MNCSKQYRNKLSGCLEDWALFCAGIDRISPPRFLTECYKMRLIHSVCLLFGLVVLYLVISLKMHCLFLSSYQSLNFLAFPNKSHFRLYSLISPLQHIFCRHDMACCAESAIVKFQLTLGKLVSKLCLFACGTSFDTLRGSQYSSRTVHLLFERSFSWHGSDDCFPASMQSIFTLGRRHCGKMVLSRIIVVFDGLLLVFHSVAAAGDWST